MRCQNKGKLCTGAGRALEVEEGRGGEWDWEGQLRGTVESVAQGLDEEKESEKG